MKTRQTGFTIIELIVVIVILGILAATALPKFFDMRASATQSAVSGIAGAAASAMNLNYSGCTLKNNVVTANVCVTINTCAGVAALMQGGLDTVTYPIAPNAAGSDIGSTNGNSALCKVTGTVGSGASATTYTATFTGIAAGN